MSDDRPQTNAVLLESRAANVWFMQNNGVALTTGITFCPNKDRSAASAFVELIRDQVDHSPGYLPLPDRRDK